MNKRMKVMIAYDGSKFADVAIDDLPRVGLPPESEVLVVSVADLSASGPATSDFALLSPASLRINASLKRERRVFKWTEDLASKAVQGLRRRFPEWKIRYEILQGNPADKVLRKAARWQPELIVAGSQGRSAIGRFFLGSVSKRLAEQAGCAVRVVRREFEKPGNAPLQLLAGASGLSDAEQLVQALGRRVWTPATSLRLVGVDDGVSAGRISAHSPEARARLETIVAPLADGGLNVSVEVRAGDPKTVFLETAENSHADAIFVIAGDARAQLSETARGLIADAKWTVEIVR